MAGGAVIVSVVAGVPAAYALARYNFKKKEDIAFQILSFKFAPEILVVLPLFMIYQMLGIYDSYFGLIWVYQLISMPLLIWVVRGYFEDISVEIEYAAQVDGYSWYQIFFKNLIPLIKPGLVSAALLAFIFAWNCFTFPLMLGGTNVQRSLLLLQSSLEQTVPITDSLRLRQRFRLCRRLYSPSVYRNILYAA